MSQQQRILTLWGQLEHDQDTIPSPPDDGIPRHVVNYGYKKINKIIGLIATHATIHSVSYSHLALPTINTIDILQIFATVIYTGPSPKEIFGERNSLFLDLPIGGSETTLLVQLTDILHMTK